MLTGGRGRSRILLCHPAAARLGVCPGQTANTALALAPNLELVDRDSVAEARVMGKLATWATRFTPAVSIDSSNALLLDVRASLKFFGGLEKLRTLLADELESHGYRFSMACAPTATASLWMARSGCDGVVRDCADLPGRLGDLSIGSLHWPADVERMLAGMGVDTVGECIRLPRDGLARRLGPGRLAELDRAFGARPEARVFHRSPQSFESSLDLPAETADAGLLMIALQELLVRLEAFTRRRQGAVQVLWIELHRREGPALTERIGLLRPSTDTGYLLELARIRFADLKLDAPVLSLTLRTALTKPPPVSDRDLLGDQAKDHENTFALVEQLRARLGAEAVHGISLVPEHRPEAAWQPVAFPGCSATRSRSSKETMDAGFHYAPVSRRPVWMLEEPRALQVSGLRLEGEPERIETGWWDSRDIRRDYYVARDRRGVQLWVYQDRREARWYLHGLFG